MSHKHSEFEPLTGNQAAHQVVSQINLRDQDDFM